MLITRQRQLSDGLQLSNLKKHMPLCAVGRLWPFAYSVAGSLHIIDFRHWLGSIAHTSNWINRSIARQIEEAQWSLLHIEDKYAVTFTSHFVFVRPSALTHLRKSNEYYDFNQRQYCVAQNEWALRIFRTSRIPRCLRSVTVKRSGKRYSASNEPNWLHRQCGPGHAANPSWKSKSCKKVDIAFKPFYSRKASVWDCKLWKAFHNFLTHPWNASNGQVRKRATVWTRDCPSELRFLDESAVAPIAALFYSVAWAMGSTCFAISVLAWRCSARASASNQSRSVWWA